VVEDPIEVAKRTMKGSVPAIVEAMVKKAKQGSCPHAKTLLEMTGANFMFDDGPGVARCRRVMGQAGAGANGAGRAEKDGRCEALGRVRAG